MKRTALTRRSVLRGLGTAIALPWLESFVPAAAAAGRVSASPPRRAAFLFVANGAHLPSWTPAETGFGFALPPTLEPLARVREEILVISGLTHDKGRANGDHAGDHARSASVFLTGAQPHKSGTEIRSGISVDQVAAADLGHLTRLPSIELGCQRGRSSGDCDSGYSCAYSNNISWTSATTPRSKEVNPRIVFERLFAADSSPESTRLQQQRRALRKSILDYATDDARRLQAKISRGDRGKLDEYLTSIREIEMRIAAAEGPRTAPDRDGREPPAGIPRSYQAHARLMCDMMVLAFQTDSTRIATCMFENAGSNYSYTEAGVSEGHHELSHHGNDAKKLEKIARINRYHVEQLAYFLERLHAIPEQGGTLLDNCMIMYGSGLSDGNRHNNENLPILIAGRGGGSISTGRHIRYPLETPVNNLLLSLLDRMGVYQDWFGDSTGRLPYLDG